LGALVVLNGPFYALIWRRRGATQAAMGVGLHALHHVTGACAIPVGILVHVRERRR
jgi:uncharacterized RDD family membrane protein YckC